MKTITTVDGNPGEITWTVPHMSNQFEVTCKIRVIFKDFSGKVLAITENDSVFAIFTS